MNSALALALTKRAINYIVSQRGGNRDYPGDKHIVARVAGAVMAVLEKLLAGKRGRYGLALDDVERFYVEKLTMKFARTLVAAWLGERDDDSVLDIGGYAEKLADYRRDKRGGA